MLFQDGDCLLDVIQAIGFSLGLVMFLPQFLGGNDVIGYLCRFNGVPCLVCFVGFHKISICQADGFSLISLLNRLVLRLG